MPTKGGGLFRTNSEIDPLSLCISLSLNEFKDSSSSNSEVRCMTVGVAGVFAESIVCLLCL